MLVAFLFSVAVQLNDPDPLRWMAIYGAAAVVCGLELAGRVRWVLPVLVGATALVWAASIAPRVLGRVPFSAMFAEFEMQNAGVEESREMYGLLIVALWMAAVAWAAHRRTRATGGPGER
jgi:hypothetical protein